MKYALMLAAVTTLATAGCEMSSSDTVKQLSKDQVEHSYVSEISIKSVPTNVSDEFRHKLTVALQDHLKACAKGQQPLKLDVTISLFSPQNAALTWLAGDSDKIKGTAQLIDPATNSVVGDYDIARSVGWGGLVAAAVMAFPEQKMSDAFADELCQRAFVKAR